MISILTPSYNRANLLQRLFKSLEEQKCNDFEWIIIDDGSIDETKHIVQNIIEGKPNFSIHYHKTQNGGKHRAINYGVTIAKGDLIYIVDSDDWLPPAAISTIIHYANSINGLTQFAGLSGCKFNENNILSGTSFASEYLDMTTIDAMQMGIKGEKAFVFYTNILKKYPFPEFADEKFISESVVWNKIAYDGYKLRWFNDNIYNFEYQRHGLSENLFNNYRNNPIGYLTYIGQEMIFLKINFLKKMIWCGKCKSTIADLKIPKETVMRILKINKLEYLISSIVFNLYKYIYKMKDI